MPINPCQFHCQEQRRACATSPAEMSAFASSFLFSLGFSERLVNPKKAGLDICHLLRDLLKSSKMGFSSLALALRYMQRYAQANPANLQYSVYPVFVTALMAASKYLDDNTYTNKTWSTLTGFRLAELNGLEMHFLEAVGFSLHVTPDEFADWLASLADFEIKRQQEALSQQQQQEILQRRMEMFTTQQQQQQQQQLQFPSYHYPSPSSSPVLATASTPAPLQQQSLQLVLQKDPVYQQLAHLQLYHFNSIDRYRQQHLQQQRHHHHHHHHSAAPSPVMAASPAPSPLASPYHPYQQHQQLASPYPPQQLLPAYAPVLALAPASAVIISSSAVASPVHLSRRRVNSSSPINKYRPYPDLHSAYPPLVSTTAATAGASYLYQQQQHLLSPSRLSLPPRDPSLAYGAAMEKGLLVTLPDPTYYPAPSLASITPPGTYYSAH